MAIMRDLMIAWKRNALEHIDAAINELQKARANVAADETELALDRLLDATTDARLASDYEIRTQALDMLLE